MLLLCFFPQHTKRSLKKFRQIDGREIHRNPLRFNLRKLQNIANQSIQPFTLIKNDLQKRFRRFLIIQRARQQRLGKAFDSRNRRLQLMRNIRYELTAHSLQSANRRDIMQHDQHA